MTKNPLKLLKKYLGELMLIIGSGIFAYNVFNFSSHVKTHCSTVDCVFKEVFGGTTEAAGVAYYYPDNTIIWLTIGTILIVIGILIIRSKKNK